MTDREVGLSSLFNLSRSFDLGTAGEGDEKFNEELNKLGLLKEGVRTRLSFGNSIEILGCGAVWDTELFVVT